MTGRAREGGPDNEKEGVELVRGHKMRNLLLLSIKEHEYSLYCVAQCLLIKPVVLPWLIFPF